MNNDFDSYPEVEGCEVRIRSNSNNGQELREALTINRDRLDDELIRQPQRFYEAGEAYARAVDSREAAKDKLKLVSADLYLRLRRKLSDKEKPTEAMVNAHVESDDEHMAAKAQLAQATAAAEQAQALKEAFSQRAWMLRELCALYVSGYYSKGSVEGPDARAVVDATAERNRKLMHEQRIARNR